MMETVSVLREEDRLFPSCDFGFSPGQLWCVGATGPILAMFNSVSMILKMEQERRGRFSCRVNLTSLALKRVRKIHCTHPTLLHWYAYCFPIPSTVSKIIKMHPYL